MSRNVGIVMLVVRIRCHVMLVFFKCYVMLVVRIRCCVMLVLLLDVTSNILGVTVVVLHLIMLVLLLYVTSNNVGVIVVCCI